MNKIHRISRQELMVATAFKMGISVEAVGDMAVLQFLKARYPRLVSVDKNMKPRGEWPHKDCPIHSEINCCDCSYNGEFFSGGFVDCRHDGGDHD